MSCTSNYDRMHLATAAQRGVPALLASLRKTTQDVKAYRHHVERCSQTTAPTPALTNECNPAKTCNVCDECCKSWIPDGPVCDACVESRCASPSPPGPPAPTSCILDGAHGTCVLHCEPTWHQKSDICPTQDAPICCVDPHAATCSQKKSFGRDEYTCEIPIGAVWNWPFAAAASAVYHITLAGILVVPAGVRITMEAGSTFQITGTLKLSHGSDVVMTPASSLRFVSGSKLEMPEDGSATWSVATTFDAGSSYNGGEDPSLALTTWKNMTFAPGSKCEGVIRTAAPGVVVTQNQALLSRCTINP